jgi:uncharacterized protein (DUF1778 family)
MKEAKVVNFPLRTTPEYSDRITRAAKLSDSDSKQDFILEAIEEKIRKVEEEKGTKI